MVTISSILVWVCALRGGADQPTTEGHLQLWLRADAGVAMPVIGWQDQSGKDLHAISGHNELPCIVKHQLTVKLPKLQQWEASLERPTQLILPRYTVRMTERCILTVANPPKGSKVWSLHVTWENDQFVLHQQHDVDLINALGVIFREPAEGKAVELAEVLIYNQQESVAKTAKHLTDKYQV